MIDRLTNKVNQLAGPEEKDKTDRHQKWWKAYGLTSPAIASVNENPLIGSVPSELTTSWRIPVQEKTSFYRGRDKEE